MFCPSRLFMYFGTHSWCSVQSAWSPQGQPRWCRENSQIFDDPGRKQWHTRLSLTFAFASSVSRLRDLLCLVHRHGLSMSKFLINWTPNFDPPVFWMCKNTITSYPLILNLWKCTLVCLASGPKLRFFRSELKIPRICTLNDINKTDPAAARRSTAKRILRLNPLYLKVIMLTNYPCWACVEIQLSVTPVSGMRRRLAQNERRASSEQIWKMTPVIRFPLSLFITKTRWESRRRAVFRKSLFWRGKHKRYFKLESLYYGVTLLYLSGGVF